VRFRVAAIAMSLAVVVASAASATTVVDQDSFFAISGNRLTAPSVRAGPVPFPQAIDVRIAQSLTAGVDGQLVKLDLQLGWRSGTAPLVISLGRGDAENGSFVVAGSFEVPAADVTPFNERGFNSLSVDVSSLGFNQTIGDEISILLSVARNDSLTTYPWVSGDADDANEIFNSIQYPGGRTSFSQDAGASWRILTADRGFRTHVLVASSAVPEPATWAQLIVGFALAGTAARRIRARQSRLS
jgi:hypothetical protein